MKKACIFIATYLVSVGLVNAAVRSENATTRNTPSTNITHTAASPRKTHNTTVTSRTTTARKTTTAPSRSTGARITSRNTTTARTANATTVSRTAITPNKKNKTTMSARTTATTSRPARAAITPLQSQTFGGAYNACRDAYFTCMDQFCATQNETYRRCACSSRLSQIKSREKLLSDTANQIQDFKDLNISIIDKTAAEVGAMISATSGEVIGTASHDTSQSAQQLANISNVLAQAKSKSLSTAGTLDIGGNINQIWNTTNLADGANIANLTGESLYNAVHAQCSQMVSETCESKSTLNMVVSAYGMYIENDCTTLSNNLDSKTNAAKGNVRETEHEMHIARLKKHNAHNSTSINDCIANVRADITAKNACGPDYVHCLDVTGRYLNRDTGAPIYSTNFYELNNQISLSGDILTNKTNKALIEELNRMRNFAAASLDTCRDIADTVWDEFMRQAITEIYQGQQQAIRTVKNECVDVVNACYDEQNKSLKDFSNIKEQLLLGQRLELSEELCREKLTACSNVYGGGPDGLVELANLMKKLTDTKIAQNCRATLQEFARDICSAPNSDTLHRYPYACRVYAPGSQKHARLKQCHLRTKASVSTNKTTTSQSTSEPEKMQNTAVATTSSVNNNEHTAQKSSTTPTAPTAIVPTEPNEPTTPNEPAVVNEPAVASEPAVLNEPAVVNEPATASEPTALNEPAVVNEPATASEPTTLNEPATVNEPAVASQTSNYNCDANDKKYSSCNANYYMTYNGSYNSTPISGNKCTACPTNATCSGGTDKFVCKAGSYITDSDGIYDANGTQCTECPDNAICSGGISKFVCKADSYITNNDGVYDANGTQCTECPDNAICNGDTDKFVCKADSYIADSDGTHNTNGTQCKACPDNATCSGGTNKFVCSAGSYITNGNGEYDANGTQCKKCTTGYNCTGGTNKFTCQTNYYITNGDGEYDTDGTQCTKCPSGYNCPGGLKNKCPTNATCDDNNKNITCAKEYYIADSDGKYDTDGTQCKKCPTNATCSGGTDKFVCKAGTYITNDKGKYNKNGTQCTTCPDGSYCNGEDRAPCQNGCACNADGDIQYCWNDSSTTTDSECGDYAGSLYQRLAQYALQACARPSYTDNNDYTIPAEILTDINAVMDSIRTDMGTELASECERLGGIWVDTVWVATEYDEKHDYTGDSLFKKFYDETGANTQWGYCTYDAEAQCLELGGKWVTAPKWVDKTHQTNDTMTCSADGSCSTGDGPATGDGIHDETGDVLLKYFYTVTLATTTNGYCAEKH